VEQVLAEPVYVDAVFGHQQLGRVRRAGAQAESGDLAATAAAEPGSERVPCDGQHA